MRTSVLVLAAMAVVALGSAAPALAQDPTTTDPATNVSTTQDDDDDFQWGIFGLIGLAGLLGLKRRDRDVGHRPTAGTTRT